MSVTDEDDGRVTVRGETERLTMLWHEQVEEAFRGRFADEPRRARLSLRLLEPGGARGNPRRR